MLRILIVDDETNIRNMIAGIVDGYCVGAVVVGQAGSVREARQKIASLHPDLVLLDIRMNDGTGFDLLEQLDRIDFRIIFITAFQEHALRAFKFSAMDYLLKPIDPQELIHAIEDAGKQINVIQEAELQHLREAVDGQGQADWKIPNRFLKVPEMPVPSSLTKFTGSLIRATCLKLPQTNTLI